MTCSAIIDFLNEVAEVAPACGYFEFDESGISSIVNDDFDEAYRIGVSDGRINFAVEILDLIYNNDEAPDITNIIKSKVMEFYGSLPFSSSKTFDSFKDSGEDIDEAYNIGENDGMIHLANEIMKML